MIGLAAHASFEAAPEALTLYGGNNRHRVLNHLHDQRIQFPASIVRTLVREVLLDAGTKTEMRALCVENDRKHVFVVVHARPVQRSERQSSGHR